MLTLIKERLGVRLKEGTKDIALLDPDIPVKKLRSIYKEILNKGKII